MKLVILVIILSLPFNSFAIDRCDVFNFVIDVGSKTISESLRCDDREAIRADLEKPFARFNLCEEENEEKGIISSAVCWMVANYIVETAIEQIPDRWKCHPDAAGAIVKVSLTKLCGTIVASVTAGL